MMWFSLIFATLSMAALGWLVWQITAWQERRDEARSSSPEESDPMARHASSDGRESRDNRDSQDSRARGENGSGTKADAPRETGSP